MTTKYPLMVIPHNIKLISDINEESIIKNIYIPIIQLKLELDRFINEKDIN